MMIMKIKKKKIIKENFQNENHFYNIKLSI